MNDETEKLTEEEIDLIDTALSSLIGLNLAYYNDSVQSYSNASVDYFPENLLHRCENILKKLKQKKP